MREEAMPEDMIDDREQIDLLVPALRDEVRRIERFAENAVALSQSMKREFADDAYDTRWRDLRSAGSEIRGAVDRIASVVRDL